MRTCPIQNCGLHIRNKLLMCPTHWGMVPAKLKSNVWRWYRQGQERGKMIRHPEYDKAALAAIAHVHDLMDQRDQKAAQGILI